MIRKKIAQYIGFPLQDFVKKTNILPTIELLNNSQYLNKDQMYEYRLKKLQQLVKHSYEHVPYYRKLFDSHGIKYTDIKTLEDIKKIPILTKEIARANQKLMIADNTNFNHVKLGKTGGTTGVPLPIHSDANNRSYTWASFYRWYKWIGIEKEDRVLTFWGAKTVLKSQFKMMAIDSIKDWLQNKKFINSFNLSHDSLPDICNQISKYDPVLIKGYLSALILIAKYMKNKKILPNKSLKGISPTSETLLPMYRNLLTDVFNVPVYDQYGFTEIPAVSYECSKHEGLHINEEHVYVEVLDEKDEYMINKSGKLIITSFNNLVTPFIRYECGDTGKLLNKKCSCGLSSQLMDSIDGRTIDTITLKNGGRVHGVFFTDLLFEIGITTDMISRFQIYQYKNGNIDFKLEAKKDIPEETLTNLKNETLRFLKHVNIVLMDFIPYENNGKFKYIKNEK